MSSSTLLKVREKNATYKRYLAIRKSKDDDVYVKGQNQRQVGN